MKPWTAPVEENPYEIEVKAEKPKPKPPEPKKVEKSPDLKPDVTVNLETKDRPKEKSDKASTVLEFFSVLPNFSPLRYGIIGGCRR